LTKAIFLENLHSPFGMALVGNDFYVANTDAVVRFTYTEGATHIDGPGEKVADLPAGPINHHWTKNLIASKDGSKVYVTVGSNSMDRQSGKWRVFASGLRNPNGMGWEPQTGALWTVANEVVSVQCRPPPKTDQKVPFVRIKLRLVNRSPT
jgi:glucose/arabinose dehydrogenase